MGIEEANHPSVERSANGPVQPPNQQTAGQLEREISQKVQALYRRTLGYQTGRVNCQFFDSKIAIVIEDSITLPVKLLVEAGQLPLAQQVRADVNSAMQPQVKQLIAQILGTEVIDVLSDAALDTGRTGIIVVLAAPPAVRNPEAILKLKPSPQPKEMPLRQFLQFILSESVR